MNIVYDNLYKELHRRSISISDLCNHMGISEIIFMKKLRGLLPWDISEAVNICCYLGNSDVKFLFLQLDTK